jgi:glycosyltransferase involved in cell wall biosynthesis
MGRVTAILLLAPDVPPAPGVMAAGPGIRYAEMAAALRREGFDVLLAAPEVGADAVWDAASIDRLAEEYDAVVLPQGHAELGRQVARRLPKDVPVVVDCYAPGIVENLSLSPEPQRFPGFRTRTVELLERGDLFLVANVPQRLYTLGLLSAIGRLNPLTYREPPILTVPYGIPTEPPRPAAPVARGVLVPEGAPLVVWYGGVYPWFDAVTAVRAFAEALREIPEAWLVIVGGRHPRAHAPDAELVRALGEARELGIEERVLEASWGPYAERAAWYAEADVAICLHHAGIETELAQRTRLADFVWGRVPFLCSQGDVVGEWASRGGAAIAVPIEDAAAGAAALLRLLRDPEARARCRSAADGLAQQITWPVVLEPLVQWLRHPRLAADRFAGERWRDALTALVRAAVDARR